MQLVSRLTVVINYGIENRFPERISNLYREVPYGRVRIIENAFQPA
jgi:hypothetical protein